MDIAKDLLKHFKLKDNPFRDTVDPRSYFKTEDQERAIVRMRYLIEDHRGLGLLTGPSGMGKTLLTQIILGILPAKRYEPLIILCHPRMSRTSLLREIWREWTGDEIKGYCSDILSKVQDKMIESYLAGRRLVLLVDEAHFLPADTLHLLRTLCNLESEKEKILTIVLIVEDFFLTRLRHSRFKALSNRISIRADLHPFSVTETEQMVKFRLLMAGSNGHLTSPEIWPEVARLSDGVPRRICRVMDHALLEAYLQQAKTITPEIMKAVAANGGC